MRIQHMSQREHTENAISRSGEGFIITGQDDDGVVVFNPKTRQTYYVTIENDIVTSCSCPHSVYRNCDCKHIVAVSTQLNIFFDKQASHYE